VVQRTPYPKEFRRDIVAVARQGEQSRAQVARSSILADTAYRLLLA
jgi:hypothetical protein